MAKTFLNKLPIITYKYLRLKYLYKEANLLCEIVPQSFYRKNLSTTLTFVPAQFFSSTTRVLPEISEPEKGPKNRKKSKLGEKLQ